MIDAPRDAGVGEPQVREPDPTDLAALYDACSPAVFRLARRLCRSSQEAEDLTHDVFLRYWKQGRYEPSRGPVLAYLLLMTRSMALNRLEQKGNRWQILQRWSHMFRGGGQAGPEGFAEVDELTRRVRDAFAAIHPNQRQVLELAYYEGLSQSAIAERLQLPVGTVKSRARKGLMALRSLLIDFSFEP
ncbi:sigma-70 family RNA polymerase sigma factor [Synechococcus sp. RSCCF101]|uniref:sigma-70 family RNA polymerase sigma factor n=1 Tax=Synechococcus sp. RSCCF101 TaxID=2511069 RepID=UPI00124510CD|nr:sigma-70 family RNA polymerase sigma factor [Synechococcus sp. RSCCF101]QEY31212.1 sigma-70 family RNA polymerase sigma factor [Synechococcus sp. RSCCF101]